MNYSLHCKYSNNLKYDKPNFLVRHGVGQRCQGEALCVNMTLSSARRRRHPTRVDLAVRTTRRRRRPTLRYQEARGPSGLPWSKNKANTSA